MRNTLYIIACLFVPAIWGYAASAIYDRINSRRKNSPSATKDGVDMYHI